MRISLHQLRTIIREEASRLRENHSDEYPEGYFGMRDHPGHDEEMEDEELPPEAFEDEEEEYEDDDFDADDIDHSMYRGWSNEEIGHAEQNRWERGLDKY